MLSEETLRQLDRLQLNMSALARGGAGGLRRSRSLGSSVEFSDFREYAPGDDIRRVDWNAYARFDRLYLKLFMEERETALTLLLDASASMALWGKWEAACRLALALAYLALRGGDRAMLVVLREGDSLESPLFAGMQGYQRACAFLAGQKPGGPTLLGRAGAGLRLKGNPGMAVLISDLFSQDDWQKCLSALLYRRQQTALAHVLAPEELEPTWNGPVRLVDSETRSTVDLMANQEALRAYARARDAFLEGAKAFCHRRSVGYGLVRSDGELLAALCGPLAQAGIVSL